MAAMTRGFVATDQAAVNELRRRNDRLMAEQAYDQVFYPGMGAEHKQQNVNMLIALEQRLIVEVGSYTLDDLTSELISQLAQAS